MIVQASIQLGCDHKGHAYNTITIWVKSESMRYLKDRIEGQIRAEGWDITPHGSFLCPECVRGTAIAKDLAVKTGEC